MSCYILVYVLASRIMYNTYSRIWLQLNWLRREEEETQPAPSPSSVLPTASINRSEMTPHFHRCIRNSLDFLSQLIIVSVQKPFKVFNE